MEVGVAAEPPPDWHGTVLAGVVPRSGRLAEQGGAYPDVCSQRAEMGWSETCCPMSLGIASSSMKHPLIRGD
jgi:hypothetical protein